MIKTTGLFVFLVGSVVLAILGAYWWSNSPPKRPMGVSPDAVFLWAGHLGLPAPKHGTWIECWIDKTASVNRCLLTEMDGARAYSGEFVPSDGKPVVQKSGLRIVAEPTSDTTNWVHVNQLSGAPLVFLENGTVLIPKDAYVEVQPNSNTLEKFEQCS
jgi:hypothetical protein